MMHAHARQHRALLCSRPCFTCWSPRTIMRLFRRRRHASRQHRFVCIIVQPPRRISLYNGQVLECTNLCHERIIVYSAGAECHGVRSVAAASWGGARWRGKHRKCRQRRGDDIIRLHFAQASCPYPIVRPRAVWPGCCCRASGSCAVETDIWEARARGCQLAASAARLCRAT